MQEPRLRHPVPKRLSQQRLAASLTSSPLHNRTTGSTRTINVCRYFTHHPYVILLVNTGWPVQSSELAPSRLLSSSALTPFYLTSAPTRRNLRSFVRSLARCPPRVTHYVFLSSRLVYLRSSALIVLYSFLAVTSLVSDLGTGCFVHSPDVVEPYAAESRLSMIFVSTGMLARWRYSSFLHACVSNR